MFKGNKFTRIYTELCYHHQRSVINNLCCSEMDYGALFGEIKFYLAYKEKAILQFLSLIKMHFCYLENHMEVTSDILLLD